MSEQLLTLFKFGLLAVLYVFFLRVLWAVRSEVTAVAEAPIAPKPKGGVGAAVAAPVSVAAAGGRGSATPAPPAEFAASAGPQTIETPQGRLIVREPEDSAGLSFSLDNELTIGRAAGCGIAIEDTFVSQLHSRIFCVRDGGVSAQYLGQGDGFYVEDLGSTNGTFLNGRRLAPNQPEHLHLADRIQVGSTVMEFV